MKKVVISIIAIIFVIVFVLSFEQKSEKNIVYHIALADPKLYTDQIFTDTFQIQKGTYQFSFVPNGDSPETLSITLKGAKFSFSEDFRLKGIPHDTGISTYYTWNYQGRKEIHLPEDDQLEITINPNGNLLGSVSVDLVKT
ncbi:MAG: hypothetical protein ACREAE_06560 [Nitrosopumilaceae archaeon]